MKKISHAMLFTLSLFSAVTAAESNDAANQFKKLDRNKNGFLSRAETAIDPVLWTRFAIYDNDKDNHLSLSEYALYTIN